MVEIPTTSTTLLQQLGEDSQHARWNEFIIRYTPMFEVYLASRFPRLEAADLLQETFLALVKALPNYRYDPTSGRHIHNYLTGILRNKALRALQQDKLHRQLPEVEASTPWETLEASERDALREIALQEFLSDTSTSKRTKQIFQRVAIKGEPAEQVASDFGLTANAVYQTKFKVLERLRATIARLEKL